MVKTLYKLNGTKIQSWTIEVQEGKYRTTEGFVDGAMTVSNWTIAKPKHIGKKNETTPAAQALLEATAKVNKKLDNHYVESIGALNGQVIPFSPMLAHEFKKHAHKLSMPVLSQPKLDGMRCIVTAQDMRSRTNNLVLGAPHIRLTLDKFFKEYPDAILDGELYNHDLKDDFNKLISLVKRGKPTQSDLEQSLDNVEYHVYDMLHNRNSSAAFYARSMEYKRLLSDIPCIVPVETTLIHSLEQLDLYYAKYLSDGYEGQMVRADDCYQEERSYYLLKRKEFITEEYKIVDILEGDGNRSGMMGRIVLELSEGKVFSANALGNVAFYTELLQNRQNYIGKQATLKFQNYTPDGVPRFGVVVAIRDYE